jgi:hypothetical protein
MGIKCLCFSQIKINKFTQTRLYTVTAIPSPSPPTSSPQQGKQQIDCIQMGSNLVSNQSVPPLALASCDFTGVVGAGECMTVAGVRS